MRKSTKKFISLTTTMAMAFSFGAANALDVCEAEVELPVSVKLEYDSVETLSDGGKVYSYVIDGIVNEFPVPPKGFSPLEATDEQLETYGFPPRPDENNTEDYNSWVEVMSCYQSTPIPEVEQVIKNENPEESENIAPASEPGSTACRFGGGYVSSLNYTENFYTQVQGDFVQPNIVAKLNPSGNTFMVGFGALEGYTAATAGTMSCMGLEQPCAYYECYFNAPLQPIKRSCGRITSVYVDPGDKIHVYVSYQKANDKFNYYIVNMTTGKSTSAVITYEDATFYSGTYSSWFAGIPMLTDESKIFNLGKFEDVTFTNCKAMINTSNSWVDLNNLRSLSISGMYFDEAEPARIIVSNITNKNTFTCKWLNY